MCITVAYHLLSLSVPSSVCFSYHLICLWSNSSHPIKTFRLSEAVRLAQNNPSSETIHFHGDWHLHYNMSVPCHIPLLLLVIWRQNLHRLCLSIYRIQSDRMIMRDFSLIASLVSLLQSAVCDYRLCSRASVKWRSPEWTQIWWGFVKVRLCSMY